MAAGPGRALKLFSKPPGLQVRGACWEGCGVPSRAGRCMGFLKCRVEMPTPLALGEAPRGASSWAGERKEGSTPPDLFRGEVTVFENPAPPCP